MTSKHPILSDEQLHWIADQTRTACLKASKAAVRRYRNASLVGFVLLIVGIGLAFHADSTSRGRIGREARSECVVLHSILLDAEARQAASGTLDLGSQAFYTKSINRLAPKGDCSRLEVR